jgi:hypothetical protein
VTQAAQQQHYHPCLLTPPLAGTLLISPLLQQAATAQPNQPQVQLPKSQPPLLPLLHLTCLLQHQQKVAGQRALLR